MENIKLNKLAKNRLSEKGMSEFTGGGKASGYLYNGDFIVVCGCGCADANNGGSSTDDNFSANNNSRLISPGYPKAIPMVR